MVRRIIQYFNQFLNILKRFQYNYSICQVKDLSDESINSPTSANSLNTVLDHNDSAKIKVNGGCLKQDKSPKS